MNEWICSSLHIDSIKYITDSQVHATNNSIRVTNQLMNQGVEIDGIQYYNTNEELIRLDLVIESDIYNNYSYISCVD